jgi:hypothetical protein
MMNRWMLIPTQTGIHHNDRFQRTEDSPKASRGLPSSPSTTPTHPDSTYDTILYHRTGGS